MRNHNVFSANKKSEGSACDLLKKKINQRPSKRAITENGIRRRKKKGEKRKEKYFLPVEMKIPRIYGESRGALE